MKRTLASLLLLATGCSREHVVHATVRGPSRPSTNDRALSLEARASSSPEVAIRTTSNVSGMVAFESDAQTYRALLPPGASITSALVRGQGVFRPSGMTFSLQTRDERVWRAGARRGEKITLPLGDNENPTVDAVSVPIETKAKHLVLEATNVRDGENILPDVITSCTAPVEGEKAFSCTLRFEGLVVQRPLELTFDLGATAYDRCADEKCAPPTSAHPRIGTAVIAY